MSRKDAYLLVAVVLFLSILLGMMFFCLIEGGFFDRPIPTRGTIAFGADVTSCLSDKI